MTALEAVSGKTWSDVSGTPTRPLQSTTTTTSRYASCSRRARCAADGVYVDDICIHDGPSMAHKRGRSLRAAMAHTSIASKAPTNFAGPWQLRWYLQRRGLDTTSTAGYTHRVAGADRQPIRE
ncbi:MAG: hypothetical protein U0521_17590 [Anaerolineae bacterium]